MNHHPSIILCSTLPAVNQMPFAQGSTDGCCFHSSSLSIFVMSLWNQRIIRFRSSQVSKMFVLKSTDEFIQFDDSSVSVDL